MACPCPCKVKSTLYIMEQFVLTYRKGFSSSCKNGLHFLLLYSLIEPIWSLQAAFGKTVLNVSGLITYLLLGLGAVCYLIPWNLWMVSDQIVNKVTHMRRIPNVCIVSSCIVCAWNQLVEFVCAAWRSSIVTMGIIYTDCSGTVLVLAHFILLIFLSGWSG